jgi:hypothetical protein
MLAEKYNNFLIKSHFLGDDIWSLLGSWDGLRRLQEGLVALTGEILLSPVFYFLVIWHTEEIPFYETMPTTSSPKTLFP